MKIAVISYHEILRRGRSGWTNDALFLIQRDCCTEHYTHLQFPPGQLDSETSRVWGELITSFSEFDKVTVYIGENSGKIIIEYIATNQLAADKAVFVLCKCDSDKKLQLLAKHGFARSRVIECECGGTRTMERIIEKFLESGDFLDL